MNQIDRRKILGAMAGSVAMAFSMTPRSVLAASETIKVGSLLSVTGRAAFLGEDMKAGLELGVEEINAAGGIGGKQIDWVFYDVESQTQKALSATRRLINQDKVDVLVSGGNMSGIALAIAPQIEASKVPFMSTEGAMAIVRPVEERKYVFKATVDDTDVLERIADYFEKKGIKKVAMLADTSGFGKGAEEQMKIVGPRRNLDVIYESFGPADTDMVPQLTRIREAGAEAIICWTVTPAGVVFLKQAVQLGLDDRTLVHSYGFVSSHYMNLAGDAANSVLLASLKLPVGDQLPDSDPLKANIEGLFDRYSKRFDRAPSLYAAESYDALFLIKEALESVDMNMSRIVEGLEGIKNYAGASGLFSFSPERHSGLSKNDIVLTNWKDGRFNLVDYQ